MIKPKHAAPVLLFFRRYIPFILKRDFQTVQVHGKAESFPRAILVLSNHFSWWDAFILFYLNQVSFRKKYHVMMLEEQLRRFWFFKYGGVFSVKKNSKDIIESLNFSIALLEAPGNLLQLFPQGKIESQHIPALHFEKGLAYIMKHSKENFHIVFTVALVDYFSKRKPALHLFYEEYHGSKESDISKIEKAYNDFFSVCKQWMITQHKQ
jgi:1-acyl-sn-glycerol-3-phosphate acyltransferase